MGFTITKPGRYLTRGYAPWAIFGETERKQEVAVILGQHPISKLWVGYIERSPEEGVLADFETWRPNGEWGSETGEHGLDIVAGNALQYACNAHDELVDALKKARDYLKRNNLTLAAERADAAIAKAEGR